MTIAHALLALVAAQLGLRIAGVAGLAARLLPVSPGRAPYLIWTARVWLSFGVPALAGLWLLQRGSDLWHLPPEFGPAEAYTRALGPFEAGPILLGLLLGTLAAAALTSWRRRRGQPAIHLGRPPRLPAAPRELPAAALLAVSAGVAEELYFRLLLPLLIVLVTGSAIAAVLASAVLFGAVHRYQGMVGMLATGAAGLLLSIVYLASGDLWLAMAVHAAIDVNALVLRPWLALRARGKSA